MENQKIFNISAIALAILFIIAAGYQSLNKDNKPVERVALNDSLESRVNSEGQVTITAIPSQTDKGLEFEISLETHSVDLSVDLVKKAALIVNNREYQPAAWEGDPLGGHHRKGVLRFAPITPQPQSFTLKIHGIGGIPERDFNW